MKKFKKYGLPVLILVALLALNLVISILLHGYVMAVVEDPFTIEGLTEVFEDQAGSQILDTCQEGDSALVLLKKEDGNVFLLEFHKNLILDRYQILDVVHVDENMGEDAWLAAGTVLRSYPFMVKDHQQIIQQGLVKHSLQFGNFFLLYGMNAVLLLIVELIVYRTGKKYQKNKKKK